MQLKDTLNLPQTEFPMRGNLTVREPARLAHWEKIGLYAQNPGNGTPSCRAFILHDGPPFTNGDVHIGTALNKLLKDIVLRHKTMRGHRTPYVPGWDCHGLPIEHKVSKELREQKKTLTPAELRAECAAFSARFIESSARNSSASASSPTGRTNTKPWPPPTKPPSCAPSPSSSNTASFTAAKNPSTGPSPAKPPSPRPKSNTRTTSARRDLRQISRARGAKRQKFGLPTDKPLSIVIWTTTPWTLPANLAIAVHPNVAYRVLQTDGRISTRRGTAGGIGNQGNVAFRPPWAA